MKFFLISVGLIFVLILILLLGFLYILEKFKSNKCKNKFQYFLPTIMGFSLAIVVIISIPIGLDSLDILANKTEVQTLVVADLQAISKVKTQDGRVFKYSSLEEELAAGQEYQVNICRRTNFAYNFRVLENVQ